jgi:hypothetical protein
VIDLPIIGVGNGIEDLKALAPGTRSEPPELIQYL